MKHLKTALLLCSFVFLIACKGEKEPENATATKAETRRADPDRQEITRLVKDMYWWVEKGNMSFGFQSVAKDSVVVGYDRAAQSLYEKKLEKSGLFAKEFVDNTARIFNKQDELLRNGKAEWLEGDMPPFGNPDVNAWCGCQDTPTDDFDKIHVVIEKTTADTAELYWNWTGFGEDWEQEHYHIKVVREKSKWKIAWMEGWDYESNVKLD
ncbi:hypothetical protein [Flavobacterium sp.]|uniref:hypothetical protein n=1 Tax=Flavobacterium sp. TaxID=239 RepID=UPI0040340158